MNLIHYPLCYMFRAPSMLMPHESTVSHGESPLDSFSDLDGTPCGLQRRSRAGELFIYRSYLRLHTLFMGFRLDSFFWLSTSFRI
ncbi:unnamed protein product [Protopolystoma xenopodis]|uniref:Uncharacterized protein n=1 Tax=Protopolystoma xenopodis TaxID=117903 RepID=A0A3S5CMV0_9PLAT|nr:unnamed protein product [Protopolystoma xenopodis]